MDKIYAQAVRKHNPIVPTVERYVSWYYSGIKTETYTKRDEHGFTWILGTYLLPDNFEYTPELFYKYVITDSAHPGYQIG